MKISKIARLAAPAEVAIMLGSLAAQNVSRDELRFREARHKEQVEGDLSAAIKIYQGLAASKADRSLAAKALLQLGLCYEKQGNAEARKAYERLLRDFGDQNATAAEARMRLPRISPAKVHTELAQRKLTPPLAMNPPATVSRDGRFSAYIDMSRSVVILLELATGKGRELGGGGRLFPPGNFGNTAAISPMDRKSRITSTILTARAISGSSV